MSPCGLAVMAAVLVSFSIYQLLLPPDMQSPDRTAGYSSVNVTEKRDSVCAPDMTYIHCTSSSLPASLPLPSPPHWLPHHLLHWLYLLTCTILLALALALASILNKHFNYHPQTTHNDLNTADDPISLTDKLQRLQIGPAHQSQGGSWLRKVEQLQLLNPTHSAESADQLVWPAQLKQSHYCLVSSTASLSLSEDPDTSPS